MRFPGGMDPAGFLTRYWQKQPLFMHGALHPAHELDPDELGWLATQHDVESRLVFTERDEAGVQYRVQHGPFEDSELAGLPDRDWTLLVHDVDKHLPDFREFFRACEFIPDWRIDDLMISFAAPGGSVGPHRDNYDVFLVQGPGIRDWRVAAEETVSKDNRSSELSLLQPFNGDRNCMASRGDVLYLPPGVPHWGTALDSCMTYSIGMRAPEFAEFAVAAERLYPDRLAGSPASEGQAIFYTDPDLDLRESGAGLIAPRSLERARRRFDAGGRFKAEEFADIFGSLVTDPKAWLEPERPDESELRAIEKKLSELEFLPVHGMSRIAHSAESSNFQLFVNGFGRRYPAAARAAISQLCTHRGLSRGEIANWRQDPALRDLLDWLLRHGAFDPGTG